MKNGIKHLLAMLLVLVLLLMLVSCGSKKELAYYADTDNYITVTGVVSYIKLSEDASALYVGFEDLSVHLSDNCFKVVDDNLKILQDALGEDTIEIGDRLEFITAPKIFGDGYVMPIVAVEKDGVELLAFADGTRNLMSWLGLKK